MSPVSISSADTAAPMFLPASVFSAMERVPVSVAGNVGALFVGSTSTSMMLIVTSISASNAPSEALTVTLYSFLVS